MKYSLILGIAIAFMLLSCNKSNQVTFTLYAPTLSIQDTIFITGGLPELGHWQPNIITMQSVGHHKWKKQIEINDTISFEYKYTLGSWDFEGAYANGLPLPNFIGVQHSKRIITDTIEFWTHPDKKVQPGKITGMVKYHHNISGQAMLPRDLIVWLPPGYKSESNQKYPVLYMLDGQNIIDPKTSTFGVDWQVDETCDSLIKNNIIKPLIVVGIYNTQQRTQEYMPGDTALCFIKFMSQTIKPLVDKNYNTKPDRLNTWIGGSSAGGNMAFMACWECPEIFSKAICMSPAFKVDQFDYVKIVEGNQKAKKPLKLYIDNGGIDIDEQLQPGIDDMLKTLQAKNFNQGTDYLWIKDSLASHNEKAWAKRFPRAIEFVSNN